MEILVNKFFCRLPQDIRDQIETKVVYHILKQEIPLTTATIVEWLSNKEVTNILPEIKALDVTDLHDLRIRRYLLSHFRKFDEKSGLPYMLDFMKSGRHLSSLFLVGKNGYGKTSLFNGLEYMLTDGYISTQHQRKIDRTENFLPYGRKSMNDIQIVLEFNSKTDNKYQIITSPLHSEYRLRTLFFSESDLQTLQGTHDLTPFFIENLGLDVINKAIIQIREILDALVPSNDADSSVPSLFQAMSSLQNDILLYATKNDKDRTNLRHQLDSILISDLKKLQYKQEIGDINMENVKRWINRLTAVLGVTTSLKNFSFYMEIQPILKQYNLVLELLEISPVDAYELYSALSPVTKTIKEVYDYATLLSNFANDKGNGTTKAENIKAAVKYIEDLIKQEEDNAQKRIEYKNRKSMSVDQMHIENLRKLYAELEKEYNMQFDKLFEVCQKTIVPLLNTFTELGKDSSVSGTDEEIVINMSNRKISAKILNKSIFGEGDTTPEQFYNSFRYKLYCLSVKVALAFMNMDLNNFNAPLIFDDVFTASDFDNSVNIDKFLTHVFTAFEGLKLGKKKDLQIILFTHDEVVLNSIASILEDMGGNEISYICGILSDTALLGDEDKCRTFIENVKDAYRLYEEI